MLVSWNGLLEFGMSLNPVSREIVVLDIFLRRISIMEGIKINHSVSTVSSKHSIYLFIH